MNSKRNSRFALSRGDRSAQPRQHVLHERRVASRLQHPPPDPVLPEGRPAVRAEQLESAGHEGPGGQAVRRAVQGAVGGVDAERRAAEAEVVRVEARAAPGRRRAA